MKASKAEIINGLEQTRKEIIENCACLPANRQEQLFLGEWSLKDLLAHFIGWDHANREALQALREQRLPEFYALVDKDWRRFNGQWVEKYRYEKFERVLAEVRVSQRALLNTLAAVPEEEFRLDRGVRYKGYKVTLAGLLEAELKEEKVHLEQVIDFLEPGERAEALFLVGYNCSQAVLQAFAARLGLRQEIAAPLATCFGAGISFQGAQCGAVSGALLVLGLEYGNSSSEDKAAKALAYTKAGEFIRRFKTIHQTVQCRELLGFDLSQPGEFERARETGVFEERCPIFVRQAAEILSSMLASKLDSELDAR
jgi:C_GCAxxG_C_C family probable redox protein